MKRRIISIITLIIVICNFSCVTSLAGSVSDSTTVTVEDIEATAGETVELLIKLSGNPGFSNLAIEVGYDKNVMTLTNATSMVVGAGCTMAQYYTSNPYNMQWDDASGVTYNGTLAALTFKINDNAPKGVYPVTVDYYKGRNGTNIDGKSINYNADYEPLNMAYNSGSITVVKQPDIKIVDTDIKNLTFNVALRADEYFGDVWAGLYTASGSLISVKRYDAAKNVNISFEKGINGDYVKVMWWEASTLKPLCEAQIIPLN